MAAYKIRLKRSDLSYFRRLALDSNKEIEAYLIGTEAENVATIVEFIYPKNYKTQTPNAAEWSQEDVDYAEKRAKELNKKIIATIHTHPDFHPIMSPTDYKESKKFGYKLLGICGTNSKERKTSVYFWKLDVALPCKIIYTDEE
jgi:proteasome lid subunit RPN8/RPN11